MRVALITFTLFVTSIPAINAAGDPDPIRRRGAEETSSQRRPADSQPRARRAPESAKKISNKEQMRKNIARIIKLKTPISCGTRAPGAFRSRLLGMKSPRDNFNVEVWGNRQRYYVRDQILYYLRSNRAAYVTLFWIGPEGSVFMPFTNIKIEANRDHVLDPGNIIVEPVGLERWRVLATLSPHQFPCQTDGSSFDLSLQGIMKNHTWATGRWDVRSHKNQRRTRRKRWRMR